MTPNHSEQQGRTGVLFYLFAALLCYAILFLGTPIAQALNPDRRYRDIFIVLTGCLGLAGGFLWGRIAKVRPESRRVEDGILLAAVAALPAYVLVQWMPMPASLAAAVSPAHGELLHSLEPLGGTPAWSSLSIVPAVTFWHFLLICSYCVLFFAAREFAVRARRKIWIVAAPVLAGGAIEAAMGLAQFLAGSETPLKGTFVIRNHLAGFLEMAMPLALAFTLAALKPGRSRHEPPTDLNWLRIGGGAGLTVAMLAVALLTLSRGGFGGIFAALVVIATFATGGGMSLGKRVLVVGGVAVVVAGVLFFATPLALIQRLSEHTSEGRVALWGEGVNLLRSYPVFGVGMGGFESGFLQFKSSEGDFVVDYAHNDYLQGLAELGAIGFLIVAALIGSAIARSVRMAAGVSAGGGWNSALGSSETRWAALGCLGSFAAILFHSAFDFNLYVPANAATLAWICGMAAGLTPSQRLARRSVEVDEGLRRHGERPE